MDIHTLSPNEYPRLLREIHRPPRWLEIAGKLPSDEHTFLCVVGSRSYSAYGKTVCQSLIEGLSGYPIVIVSGLAVGIDSLAHEAALEAGLTTIAFPGSGLGPDVLYPPSRRGLAGRIVESGGALLSPFRRDQPGAIWTFPSRNKLMAGISHAVLIIEGGRGSGTLGTAKYAEDFNRDLMIVPGPIISTLSYGPHSLMREGATPITCSTDILEHFGFAVHDAPPAAQKRQIEAPDLTPEERRVLRLLRAEHLTSSDLMEKLSVSSTALSMLMIGLELRGVVREENGRYKFAPRKDIV